MSKKCLTLLNKDIVGKLFILLAWAMRIESATKKQLCGRMERDYPYHKHGVSQGQSMRKKEIFYCLDYKPNPNPTLSHLVLTMLASLIVLNILIIQ